MQSADHGHLSIGRKRGMWFYPLMTIECLASSFWGPPTLSLELCGLEISTAVSSTHLWDEGRFFNSFSSFNYLCKMQSADHGHLSIGRKRGIYIYIYTYFVYLERIFLYLDLFSYICTILFSHQITEFWWNSGRCYRSAFVGMDLSSFRNGKFMQVSSRAAEVISRLCEESSQMCAFKICPSTGDYLEE